MTTNSESNTDLSAVPPGRYRLDPDRTIVRVDAKGMRLFPVHGTMRLRSGGILIAADPAESTVTAIIDTASYSSGIAKRDKDVTALLDARAYPAITFESRTVRQEGTEWVVTGTVSAHGHSVATDLHVSQAAPQDGAVTFHATAQLNRTDFGITKKALTVGPSARITIDAIAEAT